jgi:hypothetical protein
MASGTIKPTCMMPKIEMEFFWFYDHNSISKMTIANWAFMGKPNYIFLKNSYPV